MYHDDQFESIVMEWRLPVTDAELEFAEKDAWEWEEEKDIDSLEDWLSLSRSPYWLALTEVES